MADKDQLYRFSFEGLGLRGEVIQLDAGLQAMLEHHQDYPDAVRQLLGEAAAAVLLLSAVIKFDGSLIMQVQGQGVLKALVAQASNERGFRGLARWQGETPEGTDLHAWLQDGRMVLTVEAPNGERYQGIVPVKGERLSQALELYFEQSEQLPTRFWLACDGKRAAGLMLQSLPSQPLADEDWQRIGMFADTLDSDELLNLPVETLLHRLFHEESVRLYDPEPVAFRCSCSRERISQTLAGLGRDELEEALREQGRLNVGCEFCGRQYEFDKVDVEALLSEQAPVSSPQTRQ